MSACMVGGCECRVTCMPSTLPTCTKASGREWREEEEGGSPLPCQGQGEGKAGQVGPAGSPLSLLLLLAGVTGILATELFDQKSRPAAYMVCGVLMWILLFLVGLGFPFIMVGLPRRPHPSWGPGLRFHLCQQESPSGRSLSRETEAGGVRTRLNQEGQIPHHRLS